MKELGYIIAAVVVAGITMTGESDAQNIKTTSYTNTHGEVVETPYLTRAELRELSLRGPNGAVRLGKIMTASSVDELIGFLGKPDSTRIVNFDDGDRMIRLAYEGIRVRYYEVAGKIKLEDLEIESSEYSLSVGGCKIRPGMNSGRFAKTLRKSRMVDEEGGRRSHIIRISKSGKSNKMSAISDHEAISIDVEKGTGEVIRVRYYTTI